MYLNTAQLWLQPWCTKYRPTHQTLQRKCGGRKLPRIRELHCKFECFSQVCFFIKRWQVSKF